MVRRYSALTAFAVAFMLLAAPPPTAMGANTQLQNQIEAAGEDLDNANAAVKQALNAYNQAQRELDAAKSELAKANQVLAAANAADAAAAAELRRAEAATDAARRKLQKLKDELLGEQQMVTRLIGSVYRAGPVSQLNALLSAQSPAELTQLLQTIERWTKDKEVSIEKLTAAKLRVTEQTQVLAAAEAQVALKKEAVHAKALLAQDAAAKARAAKVKVDAAAAVRAKALAAAEKHRAAVKKRYDQLKAEQRRLEAEAKKGSAAGSGLTFSGELTWPVPGARISGNVGPRIHPVYGYRSCHTGMDLAAPSGTTIKAAADGVVVSVINSGAYGLHTLITHGSGLTTMYAHQSRASVSAGQKVTAGQKVGAVGSTGWSTGPHLHFEVRINGTAYNPMGWFGGSKTKVNC